jgi:hypothetical protein
MGYFVGGSSYEILSITDNRIELEWYSQNPFLAWYHIFTQQLRSCCISNRLYYFKFSDEFNTDGAQILQNGAMI